MDSSSILGPPDIQPPRSFWGPPPSSSDPMMNAWHPRDNDDDDDGVAPADPSHDIRSWDHASLLEHDSGDAVPEDDYDVPPPDSDAYGYPSFGFGDAGAHGPNSGREWGDLENPNPIPRRHGEKRKSDSQFGDGSFDPSSPLRSGGVVLQAPPNKGRGSGTGSLFFKTKLCIKFRAGTCPYNSNCNFAHGMEELRKPPPGWEEIVAAQEGGAGSTSGSQNIKENAAGQLVLSSSDSQRFRRTRRCKKYYSEEGCPYGERCSFLHDDQAKTRESNAISLGPGTGSASTVLSGGGNTNNGTNGERPTNWKTRMCNKWEMTGHCPFGQKCNFAHGVAELQMYSGASADYEGATATNVFVSDNKQPARTASKPDAGSSYVSATHTADGHSALRPKGTYLPPSKAQKPAKSQENWKGPADQISTIYGDWIEDEE